MPPSTRMLRVLAAISYVGLLAAERAAQLVDLDVGNSSNKAKLPPKVPKTADKTSKVQASAQKALNVESMGQSARKVDKSKSLASSEPRGKVSERSAELSRLQAKQDRKICWNSSGLDAAWKVEFPSEPANEMCDCKCDVNECGEEKCPSDYVEDEGGRCFKIDQTEKTKSVDLPLPEQFKNKEIATFTPKEGSPGVYELAVTSDCSATPAQDGNYKIKVSGSCACTYEVTDDIALADEGIEGNPTKSVLEMVDGKIVRTTTEKNHGERIEAPKERVCPQNLERHDTFCVHKFDCPQKLDMGEGGDYQDGLVCAPNNTNYKKMYFNLLARQTSTIRSKNQCIITCTAVYTKMAECYYEKMWQGRPNRRDWTKAPDSVAEDNNGLAKSDNGKSLPCHLMYPSKQTEGQMMQLEAMQDFANGLNLYLTSTFTEQIKSIGCRAYCESANTHSSNQKDYTLSGCLKDCDTKFSG